MTILKLKIILLLTTVIHLGEIYAAPPTSNSTATENAVNGVSSGSAKKEGDNSTLSVTIYTFEHFLGIPWTMDLDGCINVPGYFYKKTSSIDTHNNCLILYAREDCQGRQVKIAPGTKGHSDLSSVNFDDTLVSFQACDHVGKSKHHGNTNTTMEKKPTPNKTLSSVNKRSKRFAQTTALMPCMIQQQVMKTTPLPVLPINTSPDDDNNSDSTLKAMARATPEQITLEHVIY